MAGMKFKAKNKSSRRSLSFRNKLTLLPFKTYVLPSPGARPPPPLGTPPRSPSAPRPAPPWLAPHPARWPSPPVWTTRRGCCGSVMPIGVRLGVGARTGPGLPSGKAALGAHGLGGLTWVWMGLVWARYLGPSLPSTAAAAVPGEAPRARPEPVPHAGSMPGALAWLARAAAAAPCASRAAPRGRGGRSCNLGGGGGLPGPQRVRGRRFGVAEGCLGLLGWRPDRYRAPRGFPPRIPGKRGSGSGTGGGGGHPAGGSHQCPTSLLSWQACVAAGVAVPLPPSASVACRGQCRAVRGGGGGGGWLLRWLRAVRGWWPSTGTGAGGWRATWPTRCATGPSLGWGSGLWALWGRCVLPGGAAQGGPP